MFVRIEWEPFNTPELLQAEIARHEADKGRKMTGLGIVGDGVQQGMLTYPEWHLPYSEFCHKGTMFGVPLIFVHGKEHYVMLQLGDST